MAKRLLLLLALMILPLLVASKPLPLPHPNTFQRPDPVLLEFLGTWESQDGNWVDPMTFARIDPGKLKQDKARNDSKSPGSPGKPVSKNPANGGDGV